MVLQDDRPDGDRARAARRVPRDDQVASPRLIADVRALAERIGPRSHLDLEALDRAADWIGGELRAAGLEVEEHGYRLPGLRGDFRNVLGWRQGADIAAPILLVGAHYDTVPGSPGADDNASGVAALLELARTLPAVPPRTVALAAFSTEEASFLGPEGKGSLHCARWLLSRGARIDLMLSLEMLGCFLDGRGTQRFPHPAMRAIYGDRGDFLAVVGDLGMIGTARRVAHALGRRTGRRPPIRWFCGPGGMPGVLFSDHASFRLAGQRAVMLTDTAYLRNPHYHRGSDRAETLDEERMSMAAAALQALL